MYCPDCDVRLNGPRQWEDHKVGRKHRKKLQKQRQPQGGASNLKGISDALDWLQGGLREKQGEPAATSDDTEAKSQAADPCEAES